MIETIYDTRILELAGNIPRVGRLTRPDATATAHSKLCGSRVTVDLAMQGDVTRVVTFQLARETSTRTYPEIGVSDPHHPLTHHRGHPDFIEKVIKINTFHVELFSYFVEPNGFVTEYTTEVEQVDDSYVFHDAAYWKEQNVFPCRWGMAGVPSEFARKAMSGELVEEENQRCEQVMAKALGR